MYHFACFSTISYHLSFLVVSLQREVQKLKFEIKSYLLENISLELTNLQNKRRHLGARICGADYFVYYLSVSMFCCIDERSSISNFERYNGTPKLTLELFYIHSAS